MNTKNQIIGIIVLLILLAVMFIIRGDEDTWICEENGWVKHGNPSAPIPTEQCGEQVFVRQKQNYVLTVLELGE